MDKPLLCGKIAKDYKFWDNLMYHYKNLYPLYDKKVDFKQYTRHSAEPGRVRRGNWPSTRRGTLRWCRRSRGCT